MRFSKVPLTISLACVLVLAAFASMTFAQDNTITLTLTAPEWMQDAFTEDNLSAFEEENPGINVVFVQSGNDMYFSSAAYSPDEFLDGVEKYANRADVLYVENYNLSIEATRAGYFLDLDPLVSADPDFDPDDFVPSVWESFQWDNGIWALPASASLNVLTYSPAAFDEAGLPYPDENWTIDDFVRAAEELSQTNSRGEVTTPGFLDWGSAGLLFRALLGRGVYDDSTSPSVPMLQTPELETILTTWLEAQQAGYTGQAFSGDSQEVPMRIEGMWALSNFSADPDNVRAAALLPGGVAGLNVQGFAVSRGTQYPEAAYKLAQYLTSNIEVVSRFFGDTPARQSLIGAEAENGVQLANQLSPENEAFRQDALTRALPASELRFMDYVNVALGSMSPDGDNLDAATALQDAQNAAVTNLETAAARRDTANVFVAGPTATPVLNAGEVSITFNLTSNISPLPNREMWDREVQEFVDSDPQVGQLLLTTGFGSPSETENVDCYYTPFNNVPNMDLTQVLNLDPFMSADPDFDENDIIGGALGQVRRDDKTWAYPLSVQPEILWYDTTKFDEAGIPYPEDGWTVDQFNDALRALHVDPEDPAPFTPNYGNTYILLLTAAYGGLPLDYRTDPPTVNFNDPASVDALRQVLDLAKQGYINYSELGSFRGGGGGGSSQPIYGEILSALSWRLQLRDDDTSSEYVDPYQIAGYPQGQQFNGVAYSLGTGYINAASANPEACYRWLSELSNHPELFSSLPAKRSAIDGFADQVAQGETLRNIYEQIDTLLQDPNTVPLPSQFGGASFSIGSFILPIWLNRAMDAYVLEDADLQAELDDAQVKATAYAGCIESIPVLSLSELTAMDQDESTAYYEQFTDCAVSIDPELESMFNPTGSS